MKQSEKTMLEFAGFCFIKKPELVNELNTLIADFINKPKEQLFIPLFLDLLVSKSRLSELEQENKKLRFMVENGLGEKDLENDCC